MTELATSAAPVLFVLLSRALGGFETELVEGFTAHLAVQHLFEKKVSQDTANLEIAEQDDPPLQFKAYKNKVFNKDFNTITQFKQSRKH